MPDRMIRACLIMNPKSGHGGVNLAEALTVLGEHGWDVVVRQKLHGGHATELAREALRAGCTVVVDCGGDGTLNEIIEGVAGTDAAVGTLPGGTANLWAHEVGISPQLRVAAMQLVDADRRRVDVGRVAVNGRHKRHFVLMAGLGLDGAIMARVNKPLKSRIGPAAIGLAALQALPSWHAVPVRIDLDELHWQGRVSQVVVGNTRRYAGFTRVTGGAFMDDGLLDVCLFSAQSLIGAGRQLTSLIVRQHPSVSTAETYRAASITLRAPVMLPLQVDGGHVPVAEDELTPEGVVYTFSLIAQGVTMLVPRTYNGELFQPVRLADTPVGVELRPLELANANHTTRENGRHAGKEKQWRVKVLDVGVDCITAARLKDGHVVRLMIDPDTVLADGSGRERPLWGALSVIAEGDVMRTRGRKNGADGAILVSRVALLDRRRERKVSTP